MEGVRVVRSSRAGGVTWLHSAPLIHTSLMDLGLRTILLDARAPWPRNKSTLVSFALLRERSAILFSVPTPKCRRKVSEDRTCLTNAPKKSLGCEMSFRLFETFVRRRWSTAIFHSILSARTSDLNFKFNDDTFFSMFLNDDLEHWNRLCQDCY